MPSSFTPNTMARQFAGLANQLWGRVRQFEGLRGRARQFEGLARQDKAV